MIQEPQSILQLNEFGSFETTAREKLTRNLPKPEALSPIARQDQVVRLIVKKKQSKNTMFVVDNRHNIPKLLKDVEKDIAMFIKALQSPLQILNILPDRKIDQKSCDISFSQADFRLIKRYEKLLKHIDYGYQKLLKTILEKDRKADQTLGNFGQSKSKIQAHGENLAQQKLQDLDKNIYYNNQIVVDNLQFSFLKTLYGLDTKQQSYIPLIDVMHNIFQEIEFNVYFPTIVKITIGGISSMDKINQIADISLRLEVKVNVPGFSDSPNYYKKIFQKMSIIFKAQDLSNQFNINVKFDKEYDSDSGIKTSFEQKPKQYYEKNYKWSQYKMNTVDIDEKFQNFQGFILVADLSNVKVKLTGDQDRSPFELLDLKGILQIEQLNVYLEEIKELFFINDKQISDLIIQANPKITMKFNLVILYSRNNTELSPLILFNNITSYQNIQKDGYTLATSLMFLETSNSRTSKYELSKNPCHRRWRAKKINEAFNRYEGLKENYQLGTLPNQQDIQRDSVLNKLSIAFQRIQRQCERLQRGLYKERMSGAILRQIEKSIKILKNDQCKDHKQIFKRVDILRNIQFQLLEYQKTVNDKVSQNLLMDLEMAQQSQIILLEFKKIYLSEKFKIDETYIQEKGGLLSTEHEVQFYQISSYLDSVHEKAWRIPSIRQYQHDDYFNNSKVHYHFPIYRHPGLSLFLLFITTNILGILNLFIFFQDPSFGDRLASLATLLISFVGMIPVTQGIINSIKISLTEILIYLMMLTPLLCLGYSFYLKVTAEQLPNPLTSPFFWICFFITLLNIFVPLISFLIFKFKEEPYYNKVKASILKSFEEVNLILPGSQKLSQYKYLQEGSEKKERRSLPQVLMLSIVTVLSELYQKKLNKRERVFSFFTIRHLKDITLEKVHEKNAPKATNQQKNKKLKRSHEV